MTEYPVTLNGRDKQLILEMARRYQSNEPFPDLMNTIDIGPKTNETSDDVVNLISRFERYGFIEWESMARVKILSTVLNAANQINNPPIKNQFAELSKWWFSSRWRAALTCFAVLLPLLVQWVEMIRTILVWILQTEL